MSILCRSTVETRATPYYRTNDFVRSAIKYARRRGQPFLGHKMVPLPARWPGFSFRRYNPGEVMHGKSVAKLSLYNISYYVLVINTIVLTQMKPDITQIVKSCVK